MKQYINTILQFNSKARPKSKVDKKKKKDTYKKV